MRFLQRLMEQLGQVWSGMSLARRIGFATLTAVCLAAIVGVGYWAAQPDYRVLYSGLSMEDSGAITAKLQAQNTPFRLSGGGTTILVSAEQVQQLRLDLAVEGMPSKGDKGYAILDGNALALTPFMQHVNFGRALQAELAKTIMQIEPVAFARVHIVRPESTPFIRDQKPTTASVVLKLKPGAALNRSAASGIVALVARGVEGLKPENVTLLDTNGRMLSEQQGTDTGAVPSSQLDYRRDQEVYLASKAEEMLASLLGPGRAIVRVTADINFKHLTETRETYDADQKPIKREKITNQKSDNVSPSARGTAGAAGNLGRLGATGGASSGKESLEDTETEYYQPPKTVQYREEGAGTVERLTVAAMVDLSRGDDAAAAPSMTLVEAEEIIKQAVGFKKTRDEIKVTNVKLTGPAALTDLDKEWTQTQRWQNYINLARNASLGVAALVALVLGWLFLRRMRPLAAREPAAEPTEQGRVLERLSAVAQRDPEIMARLLSSWLEESEPARKAAA